jgi:hypothetical protein
MMLRAVQNGTTKPEASLITSSDDLWHPGPVAQVISSNGVAGCIRFVNDCIAAEVAVDDCIAACA